HLLDLLAGARIRDLGHEGAEILLVLSLPWVREQVVDAHEHENQNDPQQYGLVGLSQTPPRLSYGVGCRRRAAPCKNVSVTETAAQIWRHSNVAAGSGPVKETSTPEA